METDGGRSDGRMPDGGATQRGHTVLGPRRASRRSSEVWKKREDSYSTCNRMHAVRKLQPNPRETAEHHGATFTSCPAGLACRAARPLIVAPQRQRRFCPAEIWSTADRSAANAQYVASTGDWRAREGGGLQAKGRAAAGARRVGDRERARRHAQEVSGRTVRRRVMRAQRHGVLTEEGAWPSRWRAKSASEGHRRASAAAANVRASAPRQFATEASRRATRPTEGQPVAATRRLTRLPWSGPGATRSQCGNARSALGRMRLLLHARPNAGVANRALAPRLARGDGAEERVHRAARGRAIPKSQIA